MKRIKKIKPKPPRHDRVYHEGLAMLDGTVIMNGHLYGDYFLRAPVCASVEPAGNGVLVSVEEVGAYGYGATVDEAVEDCKSMLAEMYEHLVECTCRLSRPLQKDRNWLGAHITRRQDTKSQENPPNNLDFESHNM